MKRLRDVEAFSAITAIEQAIVCGAAAGLSNREIARDLRLSPRTIETYRLRAMRKLRLANVAQLVKFAIRAGATTLEF